MAIRHVRADILAMADVAYGLVDLDAVALRHGLPAERIVKLDANENPYGPSPKAVAALAHEASWNLYPDLTHQAVNKGLAAYAGVQPEQIVASNGCDELIQLVLQLLIEPGEQAINNVPTFSVYNWCMRIVGGQMVSIPRRREADYALDTHAILSGITAQTKLVVICNPNNPTGGMTPRDEIEAVLDTGVMVAVDETYFEFSGITVQPLLATYDNLIIMRSMSKWAGLAGLRVGYGIFHPDVARQMHKIRMPFNVNRAGYIATLASLEDKAYLLSNVAKINAEREHMLSLLRALPFLHCYPSHCNFVLCEVNGVPAQSLRDTMEQEGVLVRAYHDTYLPNAIRISVGRPEHTTAALAAMHSAGHRLKLL